MKPILLVAALLEERDAIRQRFELSGSESLPNGIEVFRGSVNGQEVLLSCFAEAGQVSAAVHVAQVVEKYQPSDVLLVGICGGLPGDSRDRVSLGDVIVADNIVYYEPAKEHEGRTEHRPKHVQASRKLLRFARTAGDAFDFRDVLTEQPEAGPKPQIRFGDYLTGERVIASNAVAADLSTLAGDPRGVEMEAYGVAKSLQEQAEVPGFLVVKAVCDLANPDKNDRWHTFAADAAATFSHRLIEALVSSQPDGSHAMTQAAVETASSVGGTHLGVIPLPSQLSLRQRLGESWRDLADQLLIPPHDRRRFRQGEEGGEIYTWLQDRDRLAELTQALIAIDRNDLVDGPSANFL